MADKDEPKVEYVDESVPVADNSASKAELKEVMTFPEDAKLHPAGEPSSDSEKEPGGVAATDPERPPFATAQPDVAILTSLATGSGQHTPPDPKYVDADGYSRPSAADK